MKLTFLLCVVAFMQVSASSFAQKISLQKNNATLLETLNDIRLQSGYNVFYDADLIKNARPINVNLHNVSIEDALAHCFDGQPFNYLIKQNTIVITPKKSDEGVKDLVFKITGKVTDDQKQPLPGVAVRVKGTSIGTVTDAGGNYSINASDQGSILVFSFIGLESQEVPANRSEINITLTAKPSNLNEVVVIGYGTQKKSDLTGSLSSIKAQDLQQSKAVSFMEAMQGRASGVQITSSSGEPGAAVNVNIRGANSFNSGTQPLYVIDGIQIDVNSGEVASSGYGNTSQGNPLATINPADIVSIEILKDASATAIFGSRGANGVILVTTKSGKANSSSLEISTSLGISSASKKFKMLGAQDYADYRFLTNPQDPGYAMDTNGDGKLDAVKDMTGVASHDWQNEVLRNALAQNYDISYSGGSAKTTFAASAGYLNQQGLILKNNYERYNLSLKVNHNATSRLKLGTNINATQSISNGPASNGGDNVRNYNGLIQTFLLARPVNITSFTDLAADPDGGTFGSPLDFVNNAYKQSPFLRLIADLSADYKIIDGLNLNVRGGGIITSSKNKEFYPSSTSWGLPANGVAILNNANTTNWYQTTTLTFTKRINKDHLLTALAGFELNSYTGESFSMVGQGFDLQTINPVDNISTAKVLFQVPTTNKYGYNRESEFGRLNYSWKDRYLLTATLRRDGSSKFGDDFKYAWFPSAAIAWRASNESFMKNQATITDLKIRGGFGVTGNDRIPPYQSLATTANTFYSGSNGTSTLGISPNTLANPRLKWETTYQYDAGVDLTLWTDRINFTADVYLKQTKDLLLQADIPGQTGFIKQWQNLGQIDNKGLELALNTINVRTGDFTWGSNFNISFNRNKVISLGSVNYIPVNIAGGAVISVGRVIVGQPIGTAYGYVFDGIYQLSDFNQQTNGTYLLKPGVTTIQGRVVRPGDPKFKDLNGDGKVDNTNDYTIISNSNPKHFGGFANNFRYKNFELNVLLQWSYGNQILNTGRYRYEAGAGYFANVTQDYWDNKWTPDNPSNKYAAVTAQGKTDISSYFVEDGSYLRLKNVTLSYNLNATPFLKKLGISGCRLYVTGENLHTWTKYTGFDPEVNSYSPLLPGIDNISYPRSRTITFGLNVKIL
jgi:TonB-linked SusC/RagA family outer membrane protein